MERQGDKYIKRIWYHKFHLWFDTTKILGCTNFLTVSLISVFCIIHGWYYQCIPQQMFPHFSSDPNSCLSVIPEFAILLYHPRKLCQELCWALGALAFPWKKILWLLWTGKRWHMNAEKFLIKHSPSPSVSAMKVDSLQHTENGAASNLWLHDNEVFQIWGCLCDLGVSQVHKS